jgi:NAD(P)-dependent dehydrogenase (short-subunit alcohol dehydrogenase family)
MATLQDKTALVTGASRGIGRATAATLARAGAYVLVHYGRSAKEAESLVSEIQAKGGRAIAISADLGNSERRCAASKTGALNRRRSIGCACAQCRNQQGGTHRGLHDRGF